MAVRGRPRKRQPVVPDHIDASKLPKYCYWDPSGQGHWYTIFKVDEKPRRARIAGPKAQLSDLHKIMEQRAGLDTDNLVWLHNKFKESLQFTQKSKSTRDDWTYCAGVIQNHPTKVTGVTVGKVPLTDWTPPQVQKLIDQIAIANGPSAAAHCARYLKRLFNWSVNRGYVKASPVPKLEMPTERKRRRLPDKVAVGALAQLARERGDFIPHTKGSCSPYIWKVLIIAYRCRLRGIEVFSLSDATVLDEGMLCERRKGSNDNITRWTPDLRAAVKAAQAIRDAHWKAKARPVPMRSEDRPLIVTEDGERMTQSTWQSAWRRFIKLALSLRVITEDQVFGLHDMKRRGATDTKGTKQEKMQATGHRSISMLDVYDFSVPVVDAAGE